MQQGITDVPELNQVFNSLSEKSKEQIANLSLNERITVLSKLKEESDKKTETAKVAELTSILKVPEPVKEEGDEGSSSGGGETEEKSSSSEGSKKVVFAESASTETQSGGTTRKIIL